MDIADQNNVSDRIIFKDFVKNPWKLINHADVFLLASRWEGMPNCILESLACGTEVIVSRDAGGINDLRDNPGVKIASNDEEFIKMMNDSVKISPKKNKISLLPRGFSIENSTNTLVKLITHKIS